MTEKEKIMEIDLFLSKNDVNPRIKEILKETKSRYEARIAYLKIMEDIEERKVDTKKYADAIRDGNYPKGTLLSLPDGRYRMPLSRAKLDDGTVVKFVFSKDEDECEIGGKLMLYASRKTDDGYLLFGKKV